MTTITREDLIPTLIENTTMQKIFMNGTHVQYSITPNSGYVLHDKDFDLPVYDEETGEETGEVILGYRTYMATCSASYDFATNPREFYAVPENDVPADQIFGGGGGNVEIASAGDENETE